MSMLMAQVGKLREAAAYLIEHSTFVGFGGVVNGDPALFDAARQMEDAADTIEGLRDRLTEESSGTMSYASDALIDTQENTINPLKAENAELVEMLEELYWCSRQFGCDRCASRECCGTLNRMRELGIKVDDGNGI